MPQGRPAIPADIERQVRIECGHCCAICGCGDSLELAHITPWAKVREHKAENLLLLCVLCHKRADHQKWGPKTLRSYKQQNWFSTHHRPRRLSTFVIPGVDLAKFEAGGLDKVKKALQAVLDVDPQSIQVITIEQGSVILTLLMPTKHVERIEKAERWTRLKLNLALTLVALDIIYEAKVAPIIAFLEECLRLLCEMIGILLNLMIRVVFLALPLFFYITAISVPWLKPIGEVLLKMPDYALTSFCAYWLAFIFSFYGLKKMLFYRQDIEKRVTRLNLDLDMGDKKNIKKEDSKGNIKNSRPPSRKTRRRR